MAVTRKLVKSAEVETKVEFTHVIENTYTVSGGQTLEEAGLNEGDDLPEDDTYEILKSKAKWDKDGRSRIITVVAQKNDYES